VGTAGKIGEQGRVDFLRSGCTADLLEKGNESDKHENTWKRVGEAEIVQRGLKPSLSVEFLFVCNLSLSSDTIDLSNFKKNEIKANTL